MAEQRHTYEEAREVLRKMLVNPVARANKEVRESIEDLLDFFTYVPDNSWENLMRSKEKLETASTSGKNNSFAIESAKQSISIFKNSCGFKGKKENFKPNFNPWRIG